MMKPILPPLMALIVLGAGAARAELTAEELIRDYAAQGFSQIELLTGPNRIKVEASDQTQEVEAIYDRATGELLQREVDLLDGDGDDEQMPGEQSTVGTPDFLRVADQGDGTTPPVASDDDDDSEDDHRGGDGHGAGGSDDHGGGAHGGDDHGGDHHGGSDQGGSDQGGDDDGDDSESEDD